MEVYANFLFAIIGNKPEPNINIIKSIINLKDFNVNVKDHNYSTLLMIASASGYFNVASQLVFQYNASINDVDNTNKTALMHAIINGNYDIVKFLILLKNIDLNVRDFKGRNALSLAIEINKNSNIVELLLSTNIIIDNDMIIRAVRNNNLLAVKLLLQNPLTKINTKDDNGFSAFSYALKNNYIEIMKELLYVDNNEINIEELFHYLSTYNTQVDGSDIIVLILKHYTTHLKNNNLIINFEDEKYKLIRSN